MDKDMENESSVPKASKADDPVQSTTCNHIGDHKDCIEKYERLEQQVENLEIADRETIVIVDGIKLDPGKSLASSVQAQINANMDIGLKEDDSVHASFIGPPPPKLK